MAMHYGLRANVDELLAKHRENIEQLRTQTADVLPKDPLYDEIFLLRFVLTHSAKGPCDFTAAADAVRKTVLWRTENAEILEQTALTGKSPNHDMCMKFSTCGYAGDMAGYEPIFVVRTGHCNSKALMSTLTMDQVRDWLYFNREVAFRKCDERTRKTRLLIKTITIIDLANYSIFAGDRRFDKCQAAASELSAIYYPQLLGKTVIMNMPSAFRALFRAAMAIMPKSMTDKVVVCPQANTEGCGRTVADCPFVRRLDGALDAVPPFLGGRMPCPVTLQPRAELESALTRVTVGSRAATTVEFEVPVRAAAAWEVVVEDFGIVMEAHFTPDLAAGDAPAAGLAHVPRYGEAECVMTRTKIKAAGGLAQGRIELPGRGLLRVVFDNSYSVFRSKTFDYRITVLEIHSDDSDAGGGGGGGAPAAAGGGGGGGEWELYGLKEEADNILAQLGVGRGGGSRTPQQ